MIRLGCLVLTLLVLAAPRAHAGNAGNPSLVEARKAVTDVRYDDARRLLVQALKQGANRPDELVEIYKLSAATAAVLGPQDLAEQYYRLMLAIDPTATLPLDASPRLRGPFVAAQAYMAAQQRFDARATRTDKGVAIAIVDPLHMVVAVATLQHGELGAQQPFTGEPVVVEDKGGEAVLLDDNGNFLRVVELPPPPEAPPPPPPHHRTPFFQRPLTYAIPAVLFGGTTTFLLVDSRLTKARLDDILAHSAMHTLDEAETERRRYRGHTIAGWIGVGVTAAFATTAIIMATRRHSAVSVTPSVGPDHASVWLDAKF